ncbi:MAG: hydroxysqualene dehydroxylase HpnE [Gammaproteobacteria bacterium]|nr:hydroxysqualene dehydroxylase HpnE [Gammaproteobacteria bacterium]MDH5594784.1 hydroxysqualene dehydroxylase HpnE [Gammaproteobacteria bacterium]MDH5614545.1 hydroxysqualene dehydroxylase HpnE [Gammaproteobacteria bacterium]
MNTKPHVVIAGGGWSGLAAAVELAQHDYKVTLLESAKQLGGRARRVLFNDMRVDNGLHIGVGAYTELLHLLDVVGVDVDKVFHRIPFQMRYTSTKKNHMVIPPSSLPKPFNLLWSFIKASGFSVREKIQALRFCAKLALGKLDLQSDISVQAMLIKNGQSTRLIHYFWEPICIGALNLAIHKASAEVFVTVMHDSFLQTRDYSDFIIPIADLGDIFPDPAMEYIENNGGSVRMGSRVTGLELDGEFVKGVYVGNELIKADEVILALPHIISRRLLTRHEIFNSVSEQLAYMGQQPITTIYLKYPDSVTTGTAMLGMHDTLGQWVFDRSLNGQPGVMAVVISADGPHMKMDNEKLIAHIADELKQLFPQWPEHEEAIVIKEKRATFYCGVASNEVRPDVETPVENCWLAGDYTATGYPATLEGAVRSGVACARHIISNQMKEELTENE